MSNPPGPLAERVAQNLVRLRTQRRLTYVEISARLAAAGRPIHRLGIQQVELGKRRIDIDDLAAFAAVFGLADPWALTVEVCKVCGGAPPQGFTCRECGLPDDPR